jgi:hypothetical protein
MAKMKQEFLATSTWTAPAGCTRVRAEGCGAGGGGGGGAAGSTTTLQTDRQAMAGGPGGGAQKRIYELDVIPGRTYDIVVGTGGNGGNGGASNEASGAVGTAGGNSQFKETAGNGGAILATFPGAGPGEGGLHTGILTGTDRGEVLPGNPNRSGTTFGPGLIGWHYRTDTLPYTSDSFVGVKSLLPQGAGGSASETGFAAGNNGTDPTDIDNFNPGDAGKIGKGGGGGAYGAGCNGGNAGVPANQSGTLKHGGVGVAGAANTGAGGGAGGGGGNGAAPGNGGNGGAGGSGRIILFWDE